MRCLTYFTEKFQNWRVIIDVTPFETLNSGIDNFMSESYLD